MILSLIIASGHKGLLKTRLSTIFSRMDAAQAFCEQLVSQRQLSETVQVACEKLTEKLGELM